MLIFTQVLSAAPDSASLGLLLLDHEQRRRGRLKAELIDGTPVGLALPSGAALRDGSVISTPLGEWCVVKAKSETTSTATSIDPFLLVRAAYHLGNRHVALELKPECLVYLADSATDQLCTSLGLHVTRQLGAFEPEKLGQHGRSHNHEVVSGNPAIISGVTSNLRERDHETR